MIHDDPTSSASSSCAALVSAQSSDDVCPPSRELAERASNGMHVRLLWRQGTRQVWVEVQESTTAWVLRIQVEPEHALDAFYHPFAYAGEGNPLCLAESIEVGGRKPRAADEKRRGQ
jgi:hypothetical protein